MKTQASEKYITKHEKNIEMKKTYNTQISIAKEILLDIKDEMKLSLPQIKEKRISSFIEFLNEYKLIEHIEEKNGKLLKIYKPEIEDKILSNTELIYKAFQPMYLGNGTLKKITSLDILSAMDMFMLIKIEAEKRHYTIPPSIHLYLNLLEISRVKFMSLINGNDRELSESCEIIRTKFLSMIDVSVNKKEMGEIYGIFSNKCLGNIDIPPIQNNNVIINMQPATTEDIFKRYGIEFNN